MTEGQKAAYVIGQAACMLVEMESMKAANQYREMQGHTIAYGEEAFVDLINRYQCHDNAALRIFGEGDQ